MTANVQTMTSSYAKSAPASNVLGKFKAGVVSWFKSHEAARTETMLLKMTDKQLVQMGITRSEIPLYCESLMAAD